VNQHQASAQGRLIATPGRRAAAISRAAPTAAYHISQKKEVEVNRLAHGPTSKNRTSHPRGLRRYLSGAQLRVLRTLLLATLAVCGAFGVAACGLLIGAAVAISTHLPPVDTLYSLPSEATRIYAADGQLVASLYQENRDSIPLSQVPRTLQRAVIDTEDADFYSNRGISVRGILRATFRNLLEKGYAEGGSTITQQLARNLFLTSEKSITRKIAEILLAIKIERRLTKDEILERYLNQVYFGQGAYGVETAAEVYFGRPARDLTLPQSALLAGMIRAPSYYSPYEHPARARRREADVLQRMVDVGDLAPKQMADALNVPLHLAERSDAGLIGIRAPYFVSYILPTLLQRYGEDVLYKGGLRIYTTLDLRLQALADAALKQGIDEALRQHLAVHQGAIVMIDPRTGYIRAMVGGYDFRTSQFNRAWQAHRQPGSAFKPFTYTVAIMRGIPPTRLLLDAPIEFTLPGGKVWKPQNYDQKWHGLVTVRYALENSINVASIRLEEEVGPKAIVELAHRMGIQSPLQANLSLTLGSSDVTLLELTSAYGAFAAGGIRTVPMAITKVTDYHGKVLEESLPQRIIVLSPEVAYVMTDLLKGNVLRGTGTAANIGRPQAGKTGTTDDFRDAWYIGYTPYLLTGVWVGNDDNSPMNHVPGGSVPAKIWASLMKQATQSQPPDDWPQPPGVVQQTLCDGANSDCRGPHAEVFIKGTEPEARSAPRFAAPAAPGGPPGGTPGAAPGEGMPVATPASAGRLEVLVTAPRDGSVVSPPFRLEGLTRPGATVHILVESRTGVVRLQVADVSVRADPSGAFAYRVDPWLKPAGGTLMITVSASDGAQEGSTGLSVTLQ
jgi:penicillin-binding protein 1A